MRRPVGFTPLEPELDAARLDRVVEAALRRMRSGRSLGGRLAELWKLSVAATAVAIVVVLWVPDERPRAHPSPDRAAPVSLLESALIDGTVSVYDAFVVLRPAPP